MAPVQPILAFAACPVTVAAPCSSFHGVTPRAAPSTSLLRPAFAKRYNRARIVALGPTPTPPNDSENESSDDPEATPTPDGEEEASASTDDVADSEASSPEEVTADDILNSPSFLKKKMELVQKELIAAKDKCDASDDAMKEEKARYVRLVADFENYRRRSVEDLRQQDTRSTAAVCKEILTVLDNFERATAAVEADSDKELAIVASYEAINKQLLDALLKLKVEPIDAVGEAFTPELHEAIQRLESTEYNEDIVCQQYTRGYKIEDTLIRAAIVAVSSGPGPEGGDETPEEGGAGDEAESKVEEGAASGADGV